MEETKKMIAIPNDDELFERFMQAAIDGVHEGIRGTISGMKGYLENAKEDIKSILKLDEMSGLSLDFDKIKANSLMATFINKQNFFVRNALKIMLMPFSADTFDHFIEKTQKGGEKDVELVVANLTKIFSLFFQSIGQKYMVSETEETIKAKIIKTCK